MNKSSRDLILGTFWRFDLFTPYLALMLDYLPYRYGLSTIFGLKTMY